ncbi:MAG: hypothetical protein J6B54_02160 [Clostridia bacterium]|nr:hypothetical protein [Clostridia bacterium]
MKARHNLKTRLMSLLLCTALILTFLPSLPFSAAGAEDAYYNRVADENTMDLWKEYFDLREGHLNTSNAGGVWTDKSVFTDASAFPARAGITMQDENRNFLTALSAIAANKEIVGYSTVPTDTVLVLDLSGSMEESNSEEDLINAANNAIQRLFAVNKNNRVGVVLYSASDEFGTSDYNESVTRILPIDRYTTGGDGKYLVLRGTQVSVSDNVRGSIANADLDNKKSFVGGTYIQAGLWEAKEMFEEMDTVIGSNNWQSDDNRMPILVLMSDGACSTGTSNYANVGESNIGNGGETGLTAGNAFLTQLTASYVMNRIEAHYQKEDADVRGLFYTLGFNIGDNEIAQSVMNPDASTQTDDLWRTYAALNGNQSMLVRVKGTSRQTRYTDVSIAKNSYVTDKSYVDQYFSASGTGLTNAFESIVDEIILQSRYYPTHLEGGSPDFSGYVEFEDALGDYMEVKDIKGILLGTTLFDGHMFASKLANVTEDGLGSIESPTELGNEFIRSVKTRLGIVDNSEAQIFLGKAFAAGQLKYNSPTDWSNYVGWYAKADGSYLGFWDDTISAAAPAEAVYKIKSYAFLGETTGSIRDSDMMYMTVQIRTDIATGRQSVVWKIPASLVPMITYLVTLEGTSVDNAENVSLTVEDANISPIRLIFESGLRSDLNELNITKITSNVADDGVTRQFWTNYFDISAPSHDQHVTAISKFTPNKENERFYYSFDSAVYRKSVSPNGSETYILLNESAPHNNNGKLIATDGNGEKYEYYHRRYIFKDAGEGSDKPIFFYEEMSAASIASAVWDATFVTKTGDTGAFVVPQGTPARELKMYDKEKDVNATDSAHMVFHPYLTEENGIFYVDMNLGNNGLLKVTPAQGLKLSKTVDIVEAGTSTDFSFLITVHNANATPYTGTANSWITDLDVVPLNGGTEISMSGNGTYTVNLSAGQTFWMTGLPAGATYTVEEISANDDYKVKSVHVNGISMGTMASGTIAASFIDDVDFVNTAVGEGDLVITKQVVDANGAPVDVSDSVKFTAEVTLKNQAGGSVFGRFEASSAAGFIDIPSNGKFTVTLAEGESFVLHNIPEQTVYEVVETNIPNGFVFNSERSSLRGTVDAESNDQALIVNTYAPTETDGQSVIVEIAKKLDGRDDWLVGEGYTFIVTRLDTTRATGTVINQIYIDFSDSDKKFAFDLGNEPYPKAGTYYYAISEAQESQGGVTYDTATRRFSVVVADSDMDGNLEIVNVVNDMLTTVTKNGNAYTVSAEFTNVYAPTQPASVSIGVKKSFSGEVYRLNGFQFALYSDEQLTTEIGRVVTGPDGKAEFPLTYAPNRASAEGETYTYYMAEIHTGIDNITYDTTVFTVKVTVKDNGDGTTSATAQVIAPEGSGSGRVDADGNAVFVNTYTPSSAAYVVLTANKKIDGKRTLNANEFTFVIEAITQNAPMPESTNDKATNDASGSVVFDAIKYTEVGTYKYKIYESNENPIGGFTYDSAYYEVTVNVTDPTDDGQRQLITTVTRVLKRENSSDRTLDPNEIMTFTNQYQATPDSVTLNGNKILTGKPLQNGEFEFKLTPVTPNAPMPTTDVATNDSLGAFTFGTITFDTAGVYTYTVTENPKLDGNGAEDPRYDCDESVYTVTVTVTDNSQGKLTAAVSMKKNGLSSSEIVFRNGFTPTPIRYNIEQYFGGKKDLNGRTLPLQAGEFEFRLINARNGKQVGDAVKNDENGVFKFPALSLPEAGIYHYKIVESVGDLKGVSYDTSSFHIRIEVVMDETGILSILDDPSTQVTEGNLLYKGTVSKQDVEGVLTEVTNYEDITDQGTDGIVFNNTYTADPAHVSLEATKTLTGRDLIDGEFKFDLHKTDASYAYRTDTVVQQDVVLRLQQDGTGNVAFMPLVFDTEGTFYYAVVEDEINEKGVTMDTTVHKVEITVRDNGKGDLIATVKVNGTDIAGSTAEAIRFKNTYRALPTSIVIEGTKTLTGRDLKKDEFTFELYDKNGTKLQAAQNGEDGKITFQPISVDAAGTYVYTVTEVQGTQADIGYDKSVYTVTATVTDHLDGTFKVEYSYSKNGAAAEKISFENLYNPKTSDNSNLWLWASLMILTSGIVGLTLYRRKKAESEN